MQFQQAKKFILQKLKKELPKYLSYHSLEHIKDVFNNCKVIAAGEGVKGESLKLLLTAALFHDSGFMVQQKDHERISCEIVRQHLPAFGYTGEQVEGICWMIMATKIPQPPGTSWNKYWRMPTLTISAVMIFSPSATSCSTSCPFTGY